MKSFQACLLVLATSANALVVPGLAKRDDCTPGLYQCQADGQHFQQCTAGKVWSVLMPVAPGTTCNPGISENPFIPGGGAAAPAPSPPAASPPAASPPAASPPAASPPAASPPPVKQTTAAPPAPVQTDSPPPPPAAPVDPPAAPPAGDSTTIITTQQTSSTTVQATVIATTTPVTTDSPPPPPAASSSPAPVTDSPPPPPSSTDNPNAGNGPNVDQVCMEFTSDNPDWTYSLQNPWGSGSGTFGSLPNGKLCVPTSNNAGGAMYIGSKPNPGPGNTKLECYFPTTGTANCDNSLVDGYSLSVKCTAGDAVIGSDLDLWKQDGVQCKDPAPGGICLNKLAYLQAESDVDNFFQEAGRQKNCIWWACNQDYFFPVTSTVKCHVSGTVPN